jgi:hypothetical protein
MRLTNQNGPPSNLKGPFFRTEPFTEKPCTVRLGGVATGMQHVPESRFGFVPVLEFLSSNSIFSVRCSMFFVEDE